MRSHTDPSLAGRCPRCRLVEPWCLCAQLPRLRSGVRIVVVRHALEALKSTNTARIAALAVEGLEIVTHGGEGDDAARALTGLDAPALLFPEGGERLPALRTLVIVDATWPQARRMVQRLAPLRALPRLSLPPAPPTGAPVLRHAAHADGRTTLDALAAALERLGEAENARALQALSRLHTLRVHAQRGWRLPGLEGGSGA